ncbi:MAG: hypothetical protein K0S00_2530 [Xanthobacteraceae bacterium]|jgi:hypothetical protein|nr:hypothetical protein [Xanthobacteraceae bacterium]
MPFAVTICHVCEGMGVLHDAMGGVEACRRSRDDEHGGVEQTHPGLADDREQELAEGVSHASDGKADKDSAEPFGAGPLGPCARRDCPQTAATRKPPE